MKVLTAIRVRTVYFGENRVCSDKRSPFMFKGLVVMAVCREPFCCDNIFWYDNTPTFIHA